MRRSTPTARALRRTGATVPCALAIGGLDPGGGAGIAADLRAFAAAGAFGCAAVTLLTIQSTAGVVRVRAIPTREVSSQSEEVLLHQRVRAIKIGALGSAENARAVGRLLAKYSHVPSVVDTPIQPTRGRASLIAAAGLTVLRDALLPRATLVTANLAEVQALLGAKVRTVGEAREAALALAGTGPRAVLVKGGHMAGPEAIDVLALDGEVFELRARRLSIGSVHGTGCTFASLVAGRLARRARERVDHETLLDAIRWAKRTHHAALRRAVRVGDGQRVLMLR
jgi:hydroxymethylpyrimidine/phosphomethylpyrimidine kinase